MESITKTVHIEYTPAHYTSKPSITIHVKESIYLKHKRWFDSFIKMREIDLNEFNNLLDLTGGQNEKSKT